MPKLEDIESFLRVAEAGAFRRAASEAGVGQSTLSRRVRRMEDQLGVSLFERSSGGVRLTNAGHDFRDRAMALMRGLERAVEIAGDAGVGKNGNLVIGTLGSLSCGVLRSLVEKTKARYPKLRLKLIEGVPEELLNALRRHELDVLFSPRKNRAEFVDWFTLATEDLCAAVSTDSPLFLHETVPWSQLASEQLIISTRDPGPMIQAEISKVAQEKGTELRLSAHD
ncbi:MAG: LysR family transcriptional regulator, partial [Pseudomonadota bacterium]